MNSRQHNFLIAKPGQILHLCHHIFRAAASHSASGIGNHAVRTKLAASVLYLNICPDVTGSPADCHICILPDLPHILYRRAAGRLLPILFQDLCNLVLTVVSHHQIHHIIGSQPVRPGLHVTPRRHHNRLGIHLFCPMEHLAGFPVRNICHRTSINNIHIRAGSKRTEFISCLF